MQVCAKTATVLLSVALVATSATAGQEEVLQSRGAAGRPGGQLVIAQRAEPKTLNPVTAIDSASRDVIRRMQADLIHINRVTQRTEPALARSWTASPDGRSYTLRLRRGVRFSDGQPFDAGDVVFSFQVYLDPKIHSPQRDLLVIGDTPLRVTKVDTYTVRFEFDQPYAAAERLFDSVAILPRHLLEPLYRADRLAGAWSVSTPARAITGLGPFRLKRYVPGERLVLERNPFYWKIDRKGQRLPYAGTLTFLFVPSDDAQVLRFEAGETDAIGRLSAESFALLQREQRDHGYVTTDLGPGLEYDFLLFNLNSDTEGRLPDVVRKQAWFRDLRFRRAVSVSIDRKAILRLVFADRATALGGFVTPGNRVWFDAEIRPPARDLSRSRELLRAAGFSWNADGALLDAAGQPVQFSILASASNKQRQQMATMIAADLAGVGMKVQVVPLEFRAQLDRVLQTHDYETAIMALGSGDVDPTAEMNVWMSSGGTHLWHLGQRKASTPWEAEIDALMQRQMRTIDPKRRKALYDRVQRLVAENLPIVPLASPHLLAAAKRDLGNFAPAILDTSIVWNADELFRMRSGQ